MCFIDWWCRPAVINEAVNFVDNCWALFNVSSKDPTPISWNMLNRFAEFHQSASEFVRVSCIAIFVDEYSYNGDFLQQQLGLWSLLPPAFVIHSHWDRSAGIVDCRLSNRSESNWTIYFWFFLYTYFPRLDCLLLSTHGTTQSLIWTMRGNCMTHDAWLAQASSFIPFFTWARVRVRVDCVQFSFPFFLDSNHRCTNRYAIVIYCLLASIVLSSTSFIIEV